MASTLVDSAQPAPLTNPISQFGSSNSPQPAAKSMVSNTGPNYNSTYATAAPYDGVPDAPVFGVPMKDANGSPITDADGNVVMRDAKSNEITEDGDSDPENTSEEEDRQKRNRMESEGARRAIAGAKSAGDKVPSGILRLWEDAYKHMQDYWQNGMTSGLEAKFTIVNMMIQVNNETDGRLSTAFTFPWKMITSVFGIYVELYGGISRMTPEERKSNVAKYLRANELLKCQLEMRGIDFRRLLNDKTYNEMNRIVQDYGNGSHRQLIDKMFTPPNTEQLAIISKAKPLAENFFSAIEKSDEHTAREHGNQLVALNDQLVKYNQEKGLIQVDHNLPIQNISSVFESGNPEQREVVAQMVVAKFNLLGVQLDVSEAFRPSEKAFQKSGQYLLEDTSGPSDQQEAEDIPMQDASETMTGQLRLAATAQPRTAAQQSPSSKLPTAAAPRPSQASPFGEKVDITKHVDQDSRSFMPVGGAPIPDSTLMIHPGLHSGITPQGKVKYVRFAGRGAYRVILNAGTENKPFYIVRNGADFPRGCAEEWFKDPELQSVSDKPRNYRPNKFEALDFFETQRNPNSCSTRAPPAYFYGLEDDKPTLWTKSEAIQRCGKATTIAAIRQRQAKRSEVQRLLEDACSRGVHPDTGKPLTNGDKETDPWLFPNAEGLSVVDSKSTVAGPGKTLMVSGNSTPGKPKASNVIADEKSRANVTVQTETDLLKKELNAIKAQLEQMRSYYYEEAAE